jgi:hypothetical protein
VAREGWPVSALQQAIRAGESATGALAAYRASGGQIRTQTWYRLYTQLQIEGALQSKELASPLNRRPTAEDLQLATTRHATGFMQRVVVMAEDNNGNIRGLDVSITGAGVVSRRAAVAEALAKVQAGMEDEDTRDRYPFKRVIGGYYQGTYEFQPESSM